MLKGSYKSLGLFLWFFLLIPFPTLSVSSANSLMGRQIANGLFFQSSGFPMPYQKPL